MDTAVTTRPRRRLLRWTVALVLAAGLLGAYAVTLDRVAARVGLDAENTLQAIPRDSDSRHRSD